MAEVTDAGLMLPEKIASKLYDSRRISELRGSSVGDDRSIPNIAGHRCDPFADRSPI